MKAGLRVFALFAGVLVFASACSTAPIQGGRQGMFDRWGSGGESEYAKPETGSREIAQIRSIARDWKPPLSEVVVTSPFGQRGRRFHEGVDLRAPTGTPVRAVSDGSVVYAGSRVKGYGRMVVLRHEAGLLTVYAHHSKNLVRVGERVKAGQKIALSGRSGRARGPHLHFEVRNRESPVDPMAVLHPPKMAVFEEDALEYEGDAHALDGNGLGEELSKLATAPADPKAVP